jgi:hypothetical protein
LIALADIKQDLPSWPDDVIDQWLLYFANEPDCGWPPPEPLDNHRWSGILGARSLSWWKEVTWKKEAVDCSLANLSNRSKEIVNQLSTAFVNKTADPVTTRRIKDAYIYILDNACLPKPMLVMKVQRGLTILDGNHRAAAFHTLQITPDESFKKRNKKKALPMQDVWIGNHSAGEVPLI